MPEEEYQLFEEVKDILDITWEDDFTDRKVKRYIEEGKQLLQNDAGAEIDFEKDLECRKLLKTYCRYARNNSEEYFIENNLQDILKMEVRYGKNQVQSTTT